MTKFLVSVLQIAAAASLLLGAGCAAHKTVQVREPAPAPVTTYHETIIREAPPALRVEVVGAAPGPEYVWVPGCWEWRGSWYWAGGHFAVAPHSNARWVPGRWTRQEQSYVWIRGYWR